MDPGHRDDVPTGPGLNYLRLGQLRLEQAPSGPAPRSSRPVRVTGWS